MWRQSGAQEDRLHDAAVVLLVKACLLSWRTVAKKNLLNETDVEGLEESACKLVKI